MRHLVTWGLEFIKLLSGRRLHPIVTQCPICGQMVRLHADQAGRRHAFAHARSLYEGARLEVHYSKAVRARCDGSGTVRAFHPRPNEHQRFNLPDPLRNE